MTSLGYPTILVKRMVFSNYDINSVKINILPFFRVWQFYHWKVNAINILKTYNTLKTRINEYFSFNHINQLTFTGNLFLTSEFEITHIFFFSLKLRHFYLNTLIFFSGNSVIWLHFTKMFTNFGGKKPNRFQVIAFCFKGDNKSCYVTHVNFSSSTLFKDIGIFFIDFI